MQKILFLCSANVWRSQMDEGYYNYFTSLLNWVSAALIEDRREKYNYSPSWEIIDIMQQEGIDISKQTVKLLDKGMCEESEKIVLLLDPSDKKSEFKIDGHDAIDFLMNTYYNKISVFPIKDPFWEWANNKILIRDQIKEFIKTLT
ncbi:MAG: hypothetical protein ACD_71C00032G0005 [uncultured bacterium (gcode 4)]|uniref:Phosphotyrosine protein phosphatase I domain-containing protein n=1 Tax=uncultured bacterium (gcode 4) TaxID=1234023 RepID=K1Z5F6_9BACT|nr:MAG: hypothetical protein ACD_71C00032G0005 [uncultured bacterium (gcode 4)]